MGSRVFVGLLEDADIDVEHHLGPLGPLLESDQPIVLMGGAVPTQEEWTQLIDWAEGGGTLVVASWPGAVPPETGAWSVISDCDPSTDVSSDGYPELDLSAPALSRLQPTKKRISQPIAYRGRNLYASQFLAGEGRVIVFADDFLLTNAAMAVEDNPTFAVRYFGGLAGDDDDTLRLVDHWTGAGAATPLEAIANSHLTPLIIQGLILLALFYLSRGIVFGRARDPKARSRREFADHVRALAGQYTGARAHQHVSMIYGSWAVERLRDRIPGGGGMEVEELAAQVAARTGRDPAEIRTLLERAATPGLLPKAAQLQLVRDLSRLLRHMGGIR